MIKAVHKWTKDVSEIEFTFHDRGSDGKVFWKSLHDWTVL